MNCATLRGEIRGKQSTSPASRDAIWAAGSVMKRKVARWMWMLAGARKPFQAWRVMAEPLFQRLSW
ncbi:hypothetical protein D3C81_1938240 [compost metagenome]